MTTAAMPHAGGLIATITLALAAAALFGFVAARLRLPPILGYLLAGVAIGPFTPGFVADRKIALELAEIGVILLMFGVGLHFSLRDLAAVRGIAIPGAVAQIATATALAAGGAALFGVPWTVGLVVGLAVSVASTVVLIRALEQRGVLDSLDGHIAIGWLVVEDLVTIIVLVLLPVIALVVLPGGAISPAEIGGELLVIAAKVGVLIAIMAFVGRRAVPWILRVVARVGSRELFMLVVLATALGFALGSAMLFGVSLALGAFLAGAVVGESDMSAQVAADALPLRDAFAVLFFVSVGMLFEPQYLFAAPLAILGVLGLVVVGKGIVALAIVLAFGHPLRTALTVAFGLAQIGEFSFIVADAALDLALIAPDAHQLVLAVAIGSIALNPFLFRLIDPLDRRLRADRRLGPLFERGTAVLARPAGHAERPRAHAIVCGHGSVGAVVAEALRRRGFAHVVVDLDRRVIERLRGEGVDALYGDAGSPVVLDHARVADARLLIVAFTDAPATRRIVEHARAVNPDIDIAVRTSSEEEWRYLREGRVNAAFWGEREVAVELVGHALRRFGVSAPEIERLGAGLRRR